jgi:hypothetical protein
VEVQDVRWDKGSIVKVGDYSFSHEKENENHQLGTGLFIMFIVLLFIHSS